MQSPISYKYNRRGQQASNVLTGECDDEIQRLVKGVARYLLEVDPNQVNKGKNNAVRIA